MTWRLSVLSRDTEYNLSDNKDYLLIGLDGIGAAPVRRITERGPMQHGESDLGYRLQSRRIAMTFAAKGGDAAAWFARRAQLLSIFRSSNSPVQLRITNGAMVRQIDCHLSGTMEMAPDELGPRWQRVAIELLAPDPTWYDPSGESIRFGLGVGTQAMEIPLVIPWQIGASIIEQAVSIAYNGTWDAWPIITINGPISDCVITNTTTGDKLDLTGVTIDDGDSYIIDCRYGYKTVTRSSDESNRIQDLTDDSNLATFRIGAHPDVLGGHNSIRITGAGANAGTTILLQYVRRFVGV
jgi:hypothetical protein